MKFTETEEKPSGCVQFDINGDREWLERRGWVVDMHTQHYANLIGYQSDTVTIGFNCYIDHLEASIISSPVGYYGDRWEESFDIQSQDDLDRFMGMIDNFIHFNL